jgi:hypothetical protein
VHHALLLLFAFTDALVHVARDVVMLLLAE